MTSLAQRAPVLAKWRCGEGVHQVRALKLCRMGVNGAIFSTNGVKIRAVVTCALCNALDWLCLLSGDRRRQLRRFFQRHFYRGEILQSRLSALC